MTIPEKRNRLLPWYIGLIVIAIADYIVATQLFSNACQAPTFVSLGVVVVIPTVYLVLMYLTLTSQK